MRRIIVSAIAIVASLALQAQNIRVNHSGVPDGNVQVSEPASKASGRFGETVMRDGEECIRVYTAEQFLKEYTLIESHTSIGTVFEDCRMYANWGDAALFSFDREFMLLGCAIYHPTENLGTMNFCEQPSASQPNFFFPNPYDQDLPSRGIGPDSVDRNGKGE